METRHLHYGTELDIHRLESLALHARQGVVHGSTGDWPALPPPLYTTQDAVHCVRLATHGVSEVGCVHDVFMSKCEELSIAAR